MKRLLNIALFYTGWMACVAGAGRGALWLGPAVVTLILAIHLWMTTRRVQEMKLVAAAGAFGFVVDTAQASGGLYAFAGTSVLPWLCPLWMVALWMLFATTLNSSMGWLAERYGLAAVLGAVCGPLSYWAGARLGAIELTAGVPLSLAGIAVVWALALPALLRLRAVTHSTAACGPCRQVPAT